LAHRALFQCGYERPAVGLDPSRLPPNPLAAVWSGVILVVLADLVTYR
jgi:hypothetical protein